MAGPSLAAAGLLRFLNDVGSDDGEQDRAGPVVLEQLLQQPDAIAWSAARGGVGRVAENDETGGIGVCSRDGVFDGEEFGQVLYAAAPEFGGNLASELRREFRLIVSRDDDGAAEIGDI